MTKPRILLIDDEIVPEAKPGEGAYMWYYSEALRQDNVDVKEVHDVDDAVALLGKDPNSFDMIILDVMMAPGKVFEAEDTGLGLRTGKPLAERIQADCPDVPVVVLTQTSDLAVREQLEKMANVRKVLYKLDCSPLDLVDEVRQVLGS